METSRSRWTIARRMYAGLAAAVLPLAALMLYQGLATSDLPQKVTSAMKAYDQALDASNGFKELLAGAVDAVDSGRLGRKSLDAMKLASTSLKALAISDPDEAPLAERADKLLARIAADPSLQTLMAVNGELQSLRAAIATCVDEHREAVTKLVNEEDARAQRQQRFTLAAALATLLLIAILMRLLVRRITRPLAHCVTVAHRIADGRLDNDIVVHGNDEIAQLLGGMRSMQDSLSSIVRSVRAGAVSVAAASEAVSAETQDLSRRSEQQAASLEEAAASMEELASTVTENTRSAQAANELAAGAAAAALKGSDEVKRLVATMQEISASSRDVRDIVGLIDGIAFQTNILALNAAVEAARAGAEGRGFAVVASEVRSLAQRSAEAARQIKDLVGASLGKIESGAHQGDEASGAIERLAADVERAVQLMKQIAGASLEQSRGIEQLSATVTEMDRTVQENAAVVHRNARASEDMRRDARGLAETVSRFSVQDEPAAAREKEELAPVPVAGLLATA
ncbi:MAG: methyl-accepting chemotaxis protein [Betaproteobacteria bacterium]